MTKPTKRSLAMLFAVIAGIKIITSFFMRGLTTFSDEPCVVQRAIYFIRNFDIERCSVITGLDAGSPLPLYSIIISPIYLFFHNMDAYYAVLVFNSLLFSTLVFPLYHIFKKFLKKDKTIYINIFLTLFLAQIFLFEKMLLTEGLFIVLNVWFLHFYLQSFDKNKIRNKGIAVIFSILAAFTRPFGFIVLLAVSINELILSKNKKRSLLIFIPLSIILTFSAIYIYSHSIPAQFYEKIQSLAEWKNWSLVIKSIKNQINSFTISTFLLPILIFAAHLNKKDSTHFKKIKYFLISFIALNFIISTQHIYGYFLEGQELNLQTRYINMSIIYIFIFSFIFFQRYKKFELSKSNTVMLGVLVVAFLFMGPTGKHAQNLDLSNFYATTPNIEGSAEFISSINLYLLPLFLIALLLLIKNKRKALIYLSIPTILIYSALSIQWTAKYPVKSELFDYFSDKYDKRITYIIGPSHPEILHVWKIFGQTDNKIDYIKLTSDDNVNITHDTDYIITEYNLDLPLELTTGKTKVYKANRTNL